MKWAIATRVVGTIAILWVVWHHSHWSVALALTGLTIANECNSYLVSDLRKAANANGPAIDKRLDRLSDRIDNMQRDAFHEHQVRRS